MSTSFLIFIFQILCFHTAYSRLTQAFFYGVEWTSSIPTTEDIDADTMEVDEIKLIANNNLLNNVPTVTGFQNPSEVINNSTATYPIHHTFSVKWDFNGELLPIDYIKIITNCGDLYPSMFCDNTKLIFNTSDGMIDYSLASTWNILKAVLVRYDNDCHNHTLLSDAGSHAVSNCGWECEECLQFLDINIDDWSMNTISSSSSSSSTCECPSFTLTLSTDNVLEVWDDTHNDYGTIVADGNNERVQMTWTRWMGQENNCRQFYLPNTDIFMTVPSYEALELQFVFNHTNGRLYHDYDSNKTQIDDFRLDVEDFLDDLFNLTWVYKVNINPTPNTTYPINTYSYTVLITSNVQSSSTLVVQMQSMYNTLSDEIVEGLMGLISDSFDINSAFIEGLYGYDIVVLADDDECSSYFLIPTSTSTKSDNTLAIIISVCAVVVLVSATVITLVIYKKRHLACFKLEWATKDGDKEVDITDPDHIYDNQKQLNKEGKKIGTATNDPPYKPAPVHIKTNSIPIVSVQPDPAYLRAQSVSTPNKGAVVVVSHERLGPPNLKHLSHGVSERVVINESVRAADISGVPFAQGLNTGKDLDVYVESTEISMKHPVLKEYDYSTRNSRNSKTSKHGQDRSSYDYRNNRNSGARKSGKNVYDAVSTTYSASPELDGNYVENQHMVQLQGIPGDKAAQYACAPQSKIDDALNKVKRSRKVIEFKNFDKELKLIKIIGEGSFGKVYKAKWDAEFVAVKIFTNISSNSISTNKIDVASTMSTMGGKGTNGSFALSNLEIKSIDDEQYKELYAEIVLATSIPPHPNIVRINGFCRNPLCVVMEYMAGGSVQKLVYGLTTRAMPSVMEKFVILVKSCYGLAKLTEYNLHHRDVASRNILLGEYQTVIDSNTKVKITDFGMTRKDDNAKDIQKTKNDGGPFKWMAPESIQKQIYNEKTDVYMFGITIWEIMYGREPYENLDAINTAMNVCMKDERPEFLWDLPSGLKTLIKKCWDKDPNKRPVFKEVARKLQKLQNNLQSDINENQEMDQVVEDENLEKEKNQAIYDKLHRFSSLASIMTRPIKLFLAFS